MLVSIILPTYNEKGNVVKLIKEIINHLKGHYEFEIIVVDDNSSDRTADVCNKVFGDKKNIRIFVREKERGLATAINFGIANAAGKYIVVMDTDINHDPKIIPLMLSEINKYDMIVGSRYIKGGGMENRRRYWLSKSYNLYLRLILRVPITDFLSGFFCINKDYLMRTLRNKNSIFVGYGEYFMRLIFTVFKSGGSFYELPVFYINRQYGESKSNFFKMLTTYTKTSIELLTSGK